MERSTNTRHSGTGAGKLNTPEEEILRLRAALRQSQRDLSVLGHRVTELETQLQKTSTVLDGAWAQLDVLRHSTSWRVTAPIRFIKASIR